MLTMIWTVWNAYGKRMESGHTISGRDRRLTQDRAGGRTEPFTRQFVSSSPARGNACTSSPKTRHAATRASRRVVGRPRTWPGRSGRRIGKDSGRFEMRRAGSMRRRCSIVSFASAISPWLARLAARMQVATRSSGRVRSDVLAQAIASASRPAKKCAQAVPACMYRDLRIVRAQAHGVGELRQRQLRLAVPDVGPAAEEPRHRQVGVERERPLEQARRRRRYRRRRRPGRSRRWRAPPRRPRRAPPPAGRAAGPRRPRPRGRSPSRMALRWERQRAAMPQAAAKSGSSSIALPNSRSASAFASRFHLCTSAMPRRK